MQPLPARFIYRLDMGVQHKCKNGSKKALFWKTSRLMIQCNLVILVNALKSSGEENCDPPGSSRLITLTPWFPVMGTNDASVPLTSTQAFVLLCQSGMWMLAVITIAALEQNLCHIFGYSMGLHFNQGISFTAQARVSWNMVNIFSWNMVNSSHWVCTVSLACQWESPNEWMADLNSH